MKFSCIRHLPQQFSSGLRIYHALLNDSGGYVCVTVSESSILSSTPGSETNDRVPGLRKGRKVRVISGDSFQLPNDGRSPCPRPNVLPCLDPTVNPPSSISTLTLLPPLCFMLCLRPTTGSGEKSKLLTVNNKH